MALLSRSMVGAILCAGFLASSGCVLVIGGEESHYIGKAWDVRPVGADVILLEVRNNVGDIDIMPEDGSEVHVEAKVYHRGEWNEPKPLQADASRDLAWEISGNVLLLRNGHLGDRDPDDWSMDLTIRVPSRLDLKIHHGVGDASIAGRGASVVAEIGVGDIHVRGTPREVRASTGVGDIELDLTDVPAAGISAECGTGSIDVTLPRGTAAEVQMQTGVGDVSYPTEMSVTQASSFVGGSATGCLGRGGPVIHLESGVGDVSLESR